MAQEAKSTSNKSVKNSPRTNLLQIVSKRGKKWASKQQTSSQQVAQGDNEAKTKDRVC
jgi:hypothetical protein